MSHSAHRRDAPVSISPDETRAGQPHLRASSAGGMSVDALLARARSRFARVSAADLDAELAAGALVVDIRPVAQRERDGHLPGAMVIDRNVLEWRLAPTSDARVVDVRDGQRVIIVCNEGYQSSLAAATLRDVGVPGATDLAGGYQAYLVARRAASAHLMPE